MRKLHVVICTAVLVMLGTIGQSQVMAQDLESPTTDLVLFFSNIDQPPVETPAPDTLIVTERSGPVTITTDVTSAGVNGEIDTDRSLPGATMVLTVKLLSLTEFTISGVITFDDAQQSTIKFESVGNGFFEEAPSIINGIPFLRGAYMARITEATGQFAGMVGIVTDNLWLDVSRPGLNNAIGFEVVTIRMAPSGF